MRFVFSLLFLLICFPQLGHAAICPAIQTNVAVYLQIAPPIVTQPFNALSLSKNVQRPDWYQGAAAQPIPGRFSNQAEIKYDIVPQTMKMPDGTFCYAIAQISYVYSLTNSQIQVATQIPAGSCGYNAVIEHETKHYLAIERLMAERKAVFEAHLRSFATGLGTHQTTNIGQTQNAIYQQIYNFVNGQVTQLQAESLQRNAAIDTVEEGRRAFTVCNGQILKALQK